MTTANATAAIEAAIATNVEDIPQLSVFDTNARMMSFLGLKMLKLSSANNFWRHIEIKM